VARKLKFSTYVRKAREQSEADYRHRTALSLVSQAGARNIAEEECPSIIAEHEARLGRPFGDWTPKELLRFSQAIPDVLTAYLGGQKRRG
jgi:hypothetical protein